jgi:carbonic anhydrase
MKKLMEGVRQFVHTVQGEERELFSRLETSQDPDVLIVTCSDSRIALHLLTQARPGDLFVMRNVGNIVPPSSGRHLGGEAATLEFATVALEVRDIIVCGHSNCGAMKGLLDPGVVAGMPLVKEWLEQCEPTRRIVVEQLSDLDAAARLERAIEINVLAQLNNLRTYPFVVARKSAGDLQLHGWVYDIGSGDVRAFDSDSGAFVSLTDSPPCT